MKTWALLFGIVVLALPRLFFYLYQRRFTLLPTYYPDRSLFEEHASVYGLHRLNVAQNVEIEGIVYEPDHTALTILYFGGKEQDSVSNALCTYHDTGGKQRENVAAIISRND